MRDVRILASNARCLKVPKFTSYLRKWLEDFLLDVGNGNLLMANIFLYSNHTEITGLPETLFSQLCFGGRLNPGNLVSSSKSPLVIF